MGPSLGPRPAAAQLARMLPIYLAAGSIFAALAARGFLVPLRASDLGADRFQIGLLFSIATLASAVLSLPAGVLSDRFGRRRTLVVSVLAGAGSQVGLAVSGDIGLFFLWQALGGIGAAASQAALFAAVGDAVPGHRLGRAMGWITLSMQLGFLGGPALAGLARHLLSVQQDILATTLLYGLALAMALTGLSGATAQASHSWDLRAPLREVTGNPGFMPVAVGLLAATLLWGTLQGYLTIFSRESLRLPDAQIGYLLALQALANGLARIPAGRLVDRIPRRTGLIAISIVFFAGSLVLLPHVHGFWQAALLLTLTVPPLATAYVALSVSFSSLATAESRGVAMGIYGTVLFAGLGLGPALFGPVMQRSGYTAGFTACAVVAAALALAVVALSREPLRGRRRPADAVAQPPPAPGSKPPRGPSAAGAGSAPPGAGASRRARPARRRAAD